MRLTGKNAKISAEATRTSIVVAVAMIDSGDHLTYSYAHPFIDPNTPPTITKQTHGAGPFNLVSPNLYTVDYVGGKITFLSANNADDVVDINNFDYVTLADVADVFDWNLDAKIETTDVTAFQDQFHVKLSTIRGWSASASSYHRSDFWFPLFNAAKPCYIKFFPDAAGAEYFIGAGFVDFGTKVSHSGPVQESVKIDGTGVLQYNPPS